MSGVGFAELECGGKVSKHPGYWFFSPLAADLYSPGCAQVGSSPSRGRLVHTMKGFGGRGGCHVMTADSTYHKVGRSLVKLVFLLNTDHVSIVGEAEL